jgi:thiamine pyrophosphokinase
MRAIIVADGDRPSRAALDATWPGWDAGVGIVVAADGGAAAARALGLTVDVLVGDADSIAPAESERLAAAGVAVEAAVVDKDETDTELALHAALRRGATEITVLGAFGGGRLDHALANIALLAHPSLAERSIELLDGRTRVRLLVAPGPDGGAATLALDGRVGDLVSLLPAGGDVEEVTTSGLRYPLVDEPLPLGPARGVSNVRLAAAARVTLRRGRLLVVESTASPPRAFDPGGRP